jgi:hypothetical protein
MVPKKQFGGFADASAELKEKLWALTFAVDAVRDAAMPARMRFVKSTDNW